MSDQHIQPDQLPLPPTLTEKLTSNFDQWEKRGRGWEYSGSVVDLEPVFGPFYHRFGSNDSSPIDDGRHPTFLSSLVDWIVEMFRGSKKSEYIEQKDWEEEPEPTLFFDTSPPKADYPFTSP